MTDRELINEFKRWIKAGRPSVWVKEFDRNWVLNPTAMWRDNVYYIVNDKHAELRKLQIDNPDTQFQIEHVGDWIDCEPNWNIDCEYRVKPIEWYETEEVKGNLVWVRDEDDEKWVVDVFKEYCEEEEFKFECKKSAWKQAKLVKPEDCYQRETNDS